MLNTAANELDSIMRDMGGVSVLDAALVFAKAGASVVFVETRPGRDPKAPLDLRTARERANDDRKAQDAAREAGDPDWESVTSGSGREAATDNPARLKSYYQRYITDSGGREPNVGLHVERSGITDIDADTADEVRAVRELAVAGTDTPPDLYPMTTASPGQQDADGRWVHKDGGHFIYVNDVPDLPLVDEFKLPGGAVVSMAKRYILVPPSSRAEGSYRNVGPVQRLSESPWLVELIRARAAENELVRERRVQAAEERAERRTAGDDTLGETVAAWNDAHPWAEILSWYGWTPSPRMRDGGCQCPVWKAPGDHGSDKSATAHEAGCTNPRVELEGDSGPLMLWTDNPPEELAGSKRWTKLQFHAAMEHKPVERVMVELGIIGPAPAAWDVSQAVLDVDEEEAFWSSSTVLEDIRTFARLRRASPWGALGAALVLVSAAIPPYVTIPALAGDRASLNLFVGLVARSGRGKGTSTRTAHAALAGLPDIPSAEAGSGEGLVKAFGLRRRSPLDPTTYMLTERFLVDVPEVDSLVSVSGRQGATISPVLRKGWSGEAQGFQYADTTKAVKLPAMAYRLAAIVGVQPLRAGGLLGEHGGGLPQRFVFLPTNDPGFTTEDREALRAAVGTLPPRVDVSFIAKRWPGTDPLVIPDSPTTPDGDTAEESGDDRPGLRPYLPIPEGKFQDVEVGPAAVAAVDADADERLAELIDSDDGQEDELAGHRTLLQLKVGVILSVLIGQEGDVTDEVWDLAGTVLAKSDETVARVRKVLRHQERKAAEAKGKAQAAQAWAAAQHTGEAVEDLRKQAHEKIHNYLEGGDWKPRRPLRDKFKTGPRRDAFESMLLELVNDGSVEEDKVGRAQVLRLVGETGS
ncbi:hypothetical protein CBI38_18015 [Rhodococcus oxybenzonivorans]|uniref:DUF3987 domain-containing protein n=1 Tax=Rhodococcus oxybenzonivorans TaxID=1990687 RepID=A0A2S2BX00_9NOCA|nr:hypothetical protein [Rhodococcus oxybenzonivorans]AWK73171.1 hypothetical protein CBI38_18015 [Rhodococcus oxybenzonivorans]